MPVPVWRAKTKGGRWVLSRKQGRVTRGLLGHYKRAGKPEGFGHRDVTIRCSSDHLPPLCEEAKKAAGCREKVSGVQQQRVTAWAMAVVTGRKEGNR